MGIPGEERQHGAESLFKETAGDPLPAVQKAGRSRELRGQPAGTRCQTGPVLARVSTLSHRRGQENGTRRRHFSRTSQGEVRRPD